MTRYDESAYQRARTSANSLMAQLSPKPDHGMIILLKGEQAIIKGAGRTPGHQDSSDHFDPEVVRTIEVIDEFLDALLYVENPPSLFHLPARPKTASGVIPFILGGLCGGIFVFVVALLVAHA